MVNFCICLFIILTTSLRVFSGELTLNQKKVAELVLQQGLKAQEAQNQYLLNRLVPYQILGKYDWNLSVESGYENDKSQLFSPLQLSQLKYERYKTTATIQKPFTTGTLFGLSVSRLSQKIDTSQALSATTIPLQQTQDIFEIGIEQALFSNTFGSSDRALTSSAEKSLLSNELERIQNLETVTLQAIKDYWEAFVAEENFRQSLVSRDRSKKLLETVKRKSSVGYTNPAELVQTQAEVESREQNVRTASIDYLLKVENLLSSLNLPLDTQVKFEKIDQILPPPTLEKITEENLRELKLQKLKAEAAELNYQASQAQKSLALSGVAKYAVSGSDDTAESSFANATSGGFPKYYVGIKLTYVFGSDLITEDIINKKANKDIEALRLQRLQLDAATKLKQFERQVTTTYFVALSSKEQVKLREKAVTELNRAYNQGRTDIKTLIDSMNNFYNSEVQYSKAFGQYQTALTEWAAARDELIPETTKGP